MKSKEINESQESSQSDEAVVRQIELFTDRSKENLCQAIVNNMDSDWCVKSKRFKQLYPDRNPQKFLVKVVVQSA
ncbi:MAG: hypothetical protein GY928_34650 [Colwellia sp.]|nr:hypothetical protein [Colwellia sp.]